MDLRDQPEDPTPELHEGREPRILPRAEHPISRKHLAEEALNVLNRLASAGHRAFLVGGAVRDLYLGKAPKDYDVATDARPSKVKRLFRNSRVIGRRFRIAHVFFPSGQTIEVATFRRSSSGTVRGDSGIILRDNEYGTPEQDALRRDLTINGLFYDIESFSVIDYVDGVQDLEDRVVRTINDPAVSFREDPVRMIRALRHAARTGFEVERETLEEIYELAPEITQTNASRLMEELFKDLRSGASEPFFRSMVQTGLLHEILPALEKQLIEHGEDHPLWQRLETLDEHARNGASYSNSVLLAAILHTVIVEDPKRWAGGSNPPNAWGVFSDAARTLPHTVRISRRDMERLLQILVAIGKLTQSYERERLIASLRHKAYLSEALDFFSIDLSTRGESTDIVEGWREFAAPPAGDDSDGSEPVLVGADGTDGEAPRRRRRRSRRRRRRDSKS